jgi:hypothetical protein
MSLTKDDLKNQISKIMEQNQPSISKVSKADREIAFYESELLTNNVAFKFQQTVSELAPEYAAQQFGTGKFTREEYMLTWDKHEEKSFRLSLTNIPHNHAKLLTECPNEFKEDIYTLLPRFIENIAQELQKISKS